MRGAFAANCCFDKQATPASQAKRLLLLTIGAVPPSTRACRRKLLYDHVRPLPPAAGILEHNRLKPHDATPPAQLPLVDYQSLLMDAICVVDAHANCLNVSGACERIFGYTPAEMVGKNMMDLVHPDDLQRTLDSIKRVMNGYQQTYFENRYVRKDGSVVSISWSAAWSEEHQVRVGVARDITRRELDDNALVAPQLLPESMPCWRLSASPRTLLAPDGVSIALSVQDHAVLLAMMRESGVVTRRTIIETLGEEYFTYDQRRLDTQIRRLRRKVEQACSHPLPVNTLRAVGFQFYQRATVHG